MQVVIVLLFLLLVYAIIGVQLFQGVLHNRCYSPDDLVASVDEDAICGGDFNTTAPAGGFTCDAGQLCLPNAPNPYFGIISFDNFGISLYNVFIVSTATWVGTMYPIQDAVGDLSSIFFVTLIILGTFFSFNLVLAAIVDTYERPIEKEKAEHESPERFDITKAELEEDEDDDEDFVDVTNWKTLTVAAISHDG